MVNWVSYSNWSYLAIFAVALLDAFFPLVPSESMVILAGALAAAGALSPPLVVAVAALAIAIYEAWVNKRGPVGWIVNIIVSLLGAFFAAQIGGFAVVMLLGPFMRESSLAASGGAVAAIGLAAAMVVTLVGSWGAILAVNRLRDAPGAGGPPA